MELVSKDFDKYEDELLSHIETCDYISFDLEMTGIENDKNNSLIDTPENRYLKYKLTAEKYSIIQLGLSFFKKNKNNENKNQILYDCFPYNLYLFPNAKDLKDLSQDNMNLEIKCMLFNRKGKIDFNKWINEGIHYLNEKQYRELYKNITENNINNDNFYIDITHLEQKISDYELAKKTIEDIKKNFIDEGKIYSNSYMIDCMPKFVLYYVKKHLPQNLYFHENFKMRRNWCTLITGYKTKEEKEELYRNDILSQLRELNHKKGAKKIIDAIFNKIYYGNIEIKDDNYKNINNIPKRKKILIGHNMSLDLLFIISKFSDKLPDDYLSFKNLIKSHLECIYDTKYLFEEFKNLKNNINNFILKDIRSTLDSMYPYLKSSFSEFVKIQIKTNYNSFIEEKYHSAGYDSYITGSCFLYMKHGIKDDEFLNESKNKIFLMNCLYKCMDLNKDEDDYIIEVNKPDDNIFVFRGVRKVNDIPFEKIFGKILWSDSVTKIFNEEKNNILIVFTNFDNKTNNNQNKTVFRTIVNSKINKDKFSSFTLGEYRIKYMKK